MSFALIATSTLLVNPGAARATAVVVFDDFYTVGAGERYASPEGHGLFANDVGIEGVVGVRVGSASHGFVDVNPADGSFTYVPDAGFVGADAFTYCVTSASDPACVSALATVRLHVEATVERIGGEDRFAVSSAVSAAKFEPGVGIVYVSSGEVFADALSASAAAGVTGSPVLLVSKSSIPRVVSVELSRLKPQRIVVLGGRDTINETVEQALQEYVPSGNLVRIGGADRYAVSAAVSAATFPRSARGSVYVASGEVFPDALSGSASAGLVGGPVLLVGKSALPPTISSELSRLAPSKIVILGGASSVSTEIETLLRSWATTVRIGGSDRYAVSAAVSAASFERTETHTVFISSGEVFPDALSGSAAAITRAAPVLLVGRDHLPEAIASELGRLNPSRIVVLGGPNTISDAVMAALKPYLKK